MKLTYRKTHDFVDIKVDEIETTIFKSDMQEAERVIRNLLEVIDSLMDYTDKSISEFIN